MVWITLALAEPPPFVSLEEAVHRAQLVVVGQAVRVEFQALAKDQVLRKSSLQPYWVEYRISEVLDGTGANVGEVVRVDFEGGGCEPYTEEVRRTDSGFVVRDADASPPVDRPLEPKPFLPEGAQILALTVHDDHWLAVGFGATPIPADEAGRTRLAKALKKK